MIPALYTHLMAAGAALAVGVSGAWWIQGQRYGLQIEKLEHQQTSAELAGMRQAAQDMAGFQKGFKDALANFQIAGQRNVEAQQGLDRRLRDLRSFTAGMRGDFSGLPDRIARAAQPALAEYATTCTAVFESMAAAGGKLAEGGAGIARKAEGHAADARLMQEAWPKTPSRPDAGTQESTP
ncbi:hypothetical protein RCH27_08700 [Paracidovorax citrulli]|uniref:hypothetical protein n=1 Tax=Paracidovorax citrulli TaxID=80869 RepID=UPI003A7F8CE8